MLALGLSTDGEIWFGSRVREFKDALGFNTKQKVFYFEKIVSGYISAVEGSVIVQTF